MQQWPLNLRLFKSPRFIPLRYRVFFVISSMLVLLLGALVVTLGYFQSQTIRHQLEVRGKSIGQSLSAISLQDLINYNYVNLERVANQAVQDPDILYVVFHDKEGRVAGFSRKPELQGKFLKDGTSLNALAAMGPLIQQVAALPDDLPGLDVTIPVYLPDSQNRWGTVRVCLSLATMQQQIRQTVWIIVAVGMVALVLGVLVSTWGTQRVTRPLGHLVRATMEVAQGNLHQEVTVNTGDEVEVLAANFSIMTREILSYQKRQTQQMEEIKRLQQYSEKLMATMADGLLSVDLSGCVAAMNPAAHKLLGTFDIDTPKGCNVSSIIEKNTPLHRFIWDIIEEPSARRQNELKIVKKGNTTTIWVSVGILRDGHGRPQEIIFNLHDITELKKLESRIRQSERLAALGTLAAGMAHEIRNPLTAIKTFVQLLPRKIDKPGFLEKFNQTVPREVNRINLLVEELLELSRAPKYEFARTDIRELLDQSLDVLAAEIQDQNIELRKEFQDGLPALQADANQLIKAFNNLSRNAIQAMASGGQLTVSAFTENASSSDSQVKAADNNWMTIVFEDTGHGISPEGIKHIFNPFFTTKDSGTGLGLPITHKVITEHGGQIEAHSVLGTGTRFTTRLPLNG